MLHRVRKPNNLAFILYCLAVYNSNFDNYEVRMEHCGSHFLHAATRCLLWHAHLQSFASNSRWMSDTNQNPSAALGLLHPILYYLFLSLWERKRKNPQRGMRRWERTGGVRGGFSSQSYLEPLHLSPQLSYCSQQPHNAAAGRRTNSVNARDRRGKWWSMCVGWVGWREVGALAKKNIDSVLNYQSIYHAAFLSQKSLLGSLLPGNALLIMFWTILESDDQRGGGERAGIATHCLLFLF